MEMQRFLRERLTQINFVHESNMDWHQMAFVEELKNDGKEQVVCTECNESAVVGPTLKCKTCQYLCHVSCFDESTIKFHFGHRHDDQLIFTEELKNEDGKEGVVCMACGEQVDGPGYKCSTSECNFQLHKSCAMLPRQKCHPSHPNHILILMPSRQYSSTCNACDARRRKDLDHMLQPEKSVDVMEMIKPGKYPYIKFGRSYKSEKHEHPLTFVRKTKDSAPCDACGKIFDAVAIECTQCKFIVHCWNPECLQKYK
ncbi:protein VACUOLELESS GAMETOPHYTES-like [Corylus avellana]|uniref:protein VACUOLELESS GAMETOPHYTES-like n=1 Tax=Corylus avellana TaxID=13451 RepID=UPI00286BCC8F|nr:protein VACUOLELESS GAMETOPHYTES-like [Corylus avellana]